MNQHVLTIRTTKLIAVTRGEEPADLSDRIRSLKDHGQHSPVRIDGNCGVFEDDAWYFEAILRSGAETCDCMVRGPRIGATYLHPKTGHRYEVLAVGIHHEKPEVFVTYRDVGTQQSFVRELYSWMNPLSRYVEESKST